MTKEELDKALMCYNRILDLEKMTHYKWINANCEWGPTEYGFMTRDEFAAILDEANEKVREMARIALAQAKAEFAKL